MNRPTKTVVFALLAIGGCRSVPTQDVPSEAPSPVAQQADLPRTDATVVLPVSHQSTAEWTLDELEGVALAHNPVLSQAAARVEAARGHWVQVGLAPNPRLGYLGDEMGDEGSAGRQGGFVAQEFITANKRGLDRQRVAWEIELAERELQTTRLRILTDVRIGFYDVLIAQRRRDLAAELVRVSGEAVEAAQALFEREEVTLAEPLRARVEADMADIMMVTSVNRHVESWRRLSSVLGRPDLEITPLSGELIPEEMGLTWQATLQQLLRESPEIAAAIARVEQARWAAQRACAEVIPDVDVQVGVARNDVNGDTLTSVTAQIPLPVFDRNEGGIRRAEAEALAAERAVDRVALDLQNRLAIAFQRYESARYQVDKYAQQDGILDKARHTLKLVRAGVYEAGEFGVLNLLTAQRTYYETNLAYLDALRELWASRMEIRGLLLQGSLQE